MYEAIEPATIAENTICVTCVFRVGAMAPKQPISMPIELKLAKPHNAYVVITTVLGCEKYDTLRK